jgi:hypothetical protein
VVVPREDYTWSDATDVLSIGRLNISLASQFVLAWTV